MGTNPEGSRDLRDARDDVPARQFSTVVSPSQPVEEGFDEGDFAEEYEAALEEGPRPVTRSVEIDVSSPSGEHDDERPTSVDGPKPSGDEDEDTIQVPGERKGQATSKRDALFGQVLAERYRILDLIGKGGMGKVYLAEHVALGKKVAVKVLNPAYTNRPDQVKRFLREAKAASTIGHENVIDITDFGEMANGQVFFAMEYLQGDDLGKLLKKSGPMPWGRARRVLLQICRALQAAHSKGIIHRDMKPENCFLIHRNGIRDFVKVLDFGIAKFLEENRDGGSNPLTQIGALIGTPEYMAPEQIHGDAADLRMDVYAVGCIMYQLLTGNLPFTDKTMYGVLSQQVNAKPVPPRQLAPDAEIPPEVEAIVLRAMEKDKNVRYQSMAELIEAIVAAPRGTPGSSADGRMGTTTNLDAAAASARIAAGLPPFGPAVNPVTPQDVSLAAGALQNSTSGVAPTAVSAPQWQTAAMDPKMLRRVVIGLGAVILVLFIGLVCALNRDEETKPPEVVAVEPTPEAKQVDPEPTKQPPPETKVEPVKPPDTTPQPKPDDEPIVVDDDGPKSNPTKKSDPVKKNPVKKSEPTKQPDPNMAGWPEELGPMERSQVNKTYKSSFETCRTISTPKGKVYKFKLKVDGPKGRVLEATPEDASAEAKCLARIFKSKVRYQPSRKAIQEFPWNVTL